MPATAEPKAARFSLPDPTGHFGPYGGVFVPETLMAALEELEGVYAAARVDSEFQKELRGHLSEFAGRPTPLYLAERLTRHCGGAKIYLKREDLLHTGAHKINNAMKDTIVNLKRIEETSQWDRIIVEKILLVPPSGRRTKLENMKGISWERIVAPFSHRTG